MVNMTGFDMKLWFFALYNRGLRRGCEYSFFLHIRRLFPGRCFCLSAKPEGSHRVEADEDFIDQDRTDHTHNKSHEDTQGKVAGHVLHFLRPERLYGHMEQQDNQGDVSEIF